MGYLLDANVFIEAKNRYYGFDFCPAFWRWVLLQNDAGKVFSVEKVGDELRSGNDDLAGWATDRGGEFFLPPDEPMLASMRTVSRWAASAAYDPSAVSTFLGGTDSYLVATALAHRHIVVTHEKASSSVKRIKIPDACIPLKVKVMNTFEMLRLERARFVLGKKK
jgi:hypothetical protein